MPERPEWILEDGKPDRESVPLMMIVGNIDVLLENTVPCSAISLRRFDRGVVLVIHNGDHEVMDAIGFKVAPLVKDEE